MLIKSTKYNYLTHLNILTFYRIKSIALFLVYKAFTISLALYSFMFLLQLFCLLLPLSSFHILILNVLSEYSLVYFSSILTSAVSLIIPYLWPSLIFKFLLKHSLCEVILDFPKPTQLYLLYVVHCSIIVIILHCYHYGVIDACFSYCYETISPLRKLIVTSLIYYYDSHFQKAMSNSCHV